MPIIDQIWSVCIAACILSVAAAVAHRRLAGTGERAGCLSMVAFVVGWLAMITAILTASFLITSR